MKKELEDKIFNNFPKFFKDRNITEKSCMQDGFRCGDGWFQLIWNTLKELQNIGFVSEILQVKEKLGELRIVMYNKTAGVMDILNDASNKSIQICEECGNTNDAKIRRGNYLKTLCTNCYKVEKEFLEK